MFILAIAQVGPLPCSSRVNEEITWGERTGLPGDERHIVEEAGKASESARGQGVPGA